MFWMQSLSTVFSWLAGGGGLEAGGIEGPEEAHDLSSLETAAN